MSLLTLGVALLLTALAVPVRAQTGGAAAHSHGADGSHAAPASTPASSAAQSATGEGEVRRIERATGRVTLRHGELKALDMPPMTMVFQARDGVLPPDLKVGDKVRFNVVSEAGRMTLTALQIVR